MTLYVLQLDAVHYFKNKLYIYIFKVEQYILILIYYKMSKQKFSLDEYSTSSIYTDSFVNQKLQVLIAMMILQILIVLRVARGQIIVMMTIQAALDNSFDDGKCGNLNNQIKLFLILNGFAIKILIFSFHFLLSFIFLSFISI